MTAYIIPVLLALVFARALWCKTDIFSSLSAGAKDGLRVMLEIFPSLLALFPAISMLRASGAFEAISSALAPLFAFFGIPSETAPLMLLRPFSGSGALGVGAELISQYGADSFIGRCAAVMLGSTETTFYVIAAYFGAAGIKKHRRAVPAALAADIAGFICACMFVRLLF